MGFYNGYILLQVVSLPKLFKGLEAEPVSTLAAVAINVAVLAYVWYVRSKLFPDFLAFTPRKLSGKYVFVT